MIPKVISFKLSTSNVQEWSVVLFIEPDTSELPSVCSELARNGCVDEKLKDAVRPITARLKNEGFTYSNPQKKISVSATINSSSKDEFMNTLAHELRHIERHICKAYDIDPYSEDVGYIAGALSEAVYPKLNELICGC